MSRHAAAAAVRTVAPAGLAALAFLLLALPSAGPVGSALAGSVPAGWGLAGWGLAAAAVAVSGLTHRPPRLGTDLPARVVIAAGVLVYAARIDSAGVGLAADLAAGVVLLAALLAEPLLHRLARPWWEAVGLPARPALMARLVASGAAWWLHCAALLLAGLLAVVAPAGWLLLPAAAVAAGDGALLADGLRRWRTGHRAELAILTGALASHRPRFLLYFAAPPGSAYQARMWLPYLDRLGQPYLVLTPQRHHLPALAAATAAPVVVYDSFEALDAVMVPSLRAAFYVNNGMHNAHCVRYAHLTHVQLYHGDSDKAVTASPLNQLYDRLFVAGQAAIDRFAAHGVQIAADRFRIVGRPQVAQLAVTERPIAEVDVPAVLYAPTWVGGHTDSNYCSLPIGPEIVARLLAAGATVIFRPHPYSERDRASAGQLRQIEQVLARAAAATGRPHRWGRAATDELSLFGCMDRSHAMICDVSSVASEYLYTGKPFAITDMRGDGARFTDAFPVARAAYVVDRDGANLPAVLTDLLGRDPLRAGRAELRDYYLGKIPPQRYVEAFLSQARDCLAEPADQLRSRV
jgi:hypothetical protein